MSSVLYQFNGVNLRTATGIAGVTCTLNNDGDDAPADLAEQEVPRRQGSVVQAARKKSRIIKIVGELGGSASQDQLQTAIDTLRAAVMGLTGPQELFAGRDDRYWLAQCESFTESYGQGKFYGTMASVQISFRAADPDAYAASAGSPVTDTATLSTSGTTNVTPAGTSATHPVWSLTINASATGTIVLANALSGESCTVSATFASGDVITLDSREATYGAYKNGTVNYGLFTGPVPRLWPGSNAISLTLTTLALSAASASYAPRYS